MYGYCFKKTIKAEKQNHFGAVMHKNKAINRKKKNILLQRSRTEGLRQA